MINKRSLILLVFIITLVIPSWAQNDHLNIPTWYEGFFLEGSLLYYFSSGILEELVEQELGFRGALGYEFNRFRFALESGYSRAAGIDPLVNEISFVPLVFKFGYALPVYSIFGLQADMDLGLLFSKINRYETAIDKIKNNSREDNDRGLFSGARVYATISPLAFFKIYAGGGADFIFEKNGVITMAALEAGLSFKPFAIGSKAASQPDIEPEPEKIVFESRSENIVIEDTPQGKTVRLLNAVYFEANSSVMIERYRPILNEAGERLRANSEQKITFRGYTAPFGTAEGRAEISAARAQYCADYLATHYGINRSRMKIESYGAERAPAFRNASWDSYRCVELIIE